MTWEGYNHEDAVLLSERLVMDEMSILLSILKNMKQRQGRQEIAELKRSQETFRCRWRCTERSGWPWNYPHRAEVRAGDILVGKVTPKETELTAEETAQSTHEKAREVRDTSLKVPHGEYGIVVDGSVTREMEMNSSPEESGSPYLDIAQKRKILWEIRWLDVRNKGMFSCTSRGTCHSNGRPLDIVL